MDDDGNRRLNAVELQSGLGDWGLHLSMTDCNCLISAIDTSGTGSVDFDDFLIACRGPMNEARLALVKQAFKICDKNGNGLVELDDLQDSFDCKFHPDFKSGKKTADEILREFMANFEGKGTVDGMITLDEFIHYYTGISSSIDRDDYFELMMRNAWHMSGGKGWSENTSNLRVLVIFKDGGQQVIGIENDLGLDHTDMRAIKTALTKQGVSNIQKIRLT